MRNLKKILALALALVMTLSLMTVANAFNDDSQIDAKYDEAVTVLSNLKVFKGVNDGSNFAPKQTISRGEVAAIIYRIVTGDVSNTNIAQHAAYAAQAFDDVKATDWDAGYIGYCANAQIIVGDGTNFYPRQEVNGYQALAMILRAIGYDANKEFQGEGWEIRTASTAQQLGLLKNIGASSLSADATREMVAEILFRTIAEAYIVQYTSAFGYQPVYLPASENDPASTSIPLFGNVVTATLGYRTFGLEKTSGEITAVGRSAGTTTFGSWKTTGIWNKTNVFSNDVTVTGTNTAWTDIGYGAYVYTIPATGAKTRTAVSDVVITGESLLTSTDGTAHAVLTAAANGKVTVDSPVNVYYNGMLTAANATATVPSTSQALARVDDRGVKVDYIDNDNGGRAEAIVITEYTAAQVTGIATDTTTTGNNAVAANTYYLSGVGVATKNLVASETLSMGDVVTYVEYAKDYYVTKAPAAVGVLTKVTEKSNPIDATYTIGGADYVKSDVSGLGMSALNRVNVGRNFQVYTDPYGYIIKADIVVSADYLYVYANRETDTTTGLTSAKVVFEDGSVSTVNVKTVNSVPTTNHVWVAEQLTGDIYSYTVNADGSYNLTPATDGVTNAPYTKGSVYWGGTGVDSASTVVDIRLMNAATTSNTVFTGKDNIPSLVNVELTYVEAADGDIDVAFLTQGGADDTTEIFIYKTDEFTYSYDWTENVGHAYTDAVVNGVLVEDCALTHDQYEDIQEFGTGIYTYYGDELVFSSFDEQWGTVTWNNNVVTFNYNGRTYKYGYDEVNFAVLDVSKGTASTFSLLNSGADGLNGERAIIRWNESGDVASIYFVVGEMANTVMDYGVAGQAKNGGWYSYAVADGYITTHIETIMDQLVVEFYGATAAATEPGTDGRYDITVTYTNALKASSGLVVKNGYVNSLTDSTGESLNVDDISDVPGTAGATYYLNVTDYTGQKYTFELTLQAATEDLGLYKNGSTTSEDTVSTWTGTGTIAQMEDSYNSNVTWTHYSSVGVVVDPESHDVSALDFSVAVVKADNGKTSTYWVYQSGKTETGDDLVADMADSIDPANEKQVLEVVQYAEEHSINSNSAMKALDAAGVDKAVIVDTFMDVYSGAGYKHAAVSEQLVNNLVSDLDDAKEVVDAYLTWIGAELAADASDITNTANLSIEKTATGWAVDFTQVPISPTNIANTGLGGLGTALATKFSSGYTVSATWTDQNGGSGSTANALTKNWNGELTNVVNDVATYDITFTVTEDANPTNTITFSVTLG